MRLSVIGMALAGAILWGVFGLFLVGLANLAWKGYGQSFLDVMASIYPGYRATPSFGQVIVGTLYALVDGFVGGAIFAWLYNGFSGQSATPPVD